MSTFCHPIIHIPPHADDILYVYSYIATRLEQTEVHMSFLETVKGLLGGTYMNVLVYAAILFVFILGLIKCVLPVLRNRGLLNRAIKNIRAGEDAQQSWQEEEFLGKGVLKDHWSEYLNNLFFADGVYHNASNVEDFINEETVIEGPGRSSFSDAVPSVLVSMGFLGTLIGLAQGLSGFSMSDSAAVMDSIVTLIPGMKYAFMTSIFGVVGSIGFTLITRAVHGSTVRTLRTFYSAMSRQVGLVTVDPMTQIATYQQEQTVLIRQLAEDLSGKITDNIARAVGQAVEPLNQSLRNFVTVNTKEQMRFLDAVVTRFIERMDETLGGQITNLSRAMEEAARYQEESMHSVRISLNETSEMLDSIRAVTNIADEMVRNNAQYIQDLRENQQQTDDAFQRVASSVEQMDLISRQQANYLKSVSAMHAEVTRSVDQMTSAMSTFTERMAEHSANANTGMLKAAAELRATGAQLEEIHRNCANAVTEELKLTMDAYQQYVNEFTHRVDYLASGITDSLSQLPHAVDDAANGLLDQVDRLTDGILQAQRALNDTVERLYDDPRQHQ